jgi:hypothetical protein
MPVVIFTGSVLLTNFDLPSQKNSVKWKEALSNSKILLLSQRTEDQFRAFVLGPNLKLQYALVQFLKVTKYILFAIASITDIMLPLIP